jgi:cytochrome c oxidase assembly protein subunit 15
MNASTEHTYRPALHWFWVLTAISTVVLIFFGAKVTSGGYGLSVPDWPTSFGHLMPPPPENSPNQGFWGGMVGGIFWEHSHRMIASGVGLLTLIGTIWVLAVENRKIIRWLSIIALAAVVFQGILGGLTVINYLPDWLSTSHATLGQTFFLLACAMVMITSRLFIQKTSQSESEDAAKSAPQFNESLGFLKVLSIIALASLYIQLIVGGFMRHGEAGLAVPTFPSAYGEFWPALDEDSMETYRWEAMMLFAANPDVSPRVEEAAGRISSYQIAIHLAHRYWAIGVTLILTFMAIIIFRNYKQSLLLVGLAASMLGLLTIQVLLGIFTILSMRNEVVASLHVLGGAFLLANTFAIVFWSFFLPDNSADSTSTAASQSAQPSLAPVHAK